MPENLQNNPWFQLILVLAFAGAIVYFGTSVWPNTAEMKTQIAGLNDSITKLQDIVNDGRKLEMRLPELRREIKTKELELENLKKIIPSESEVEDLIRKLERMAGETNISVKSFQSQPRITKEFYFEWPISITATGSYHNLGKFFSKISNYARIINVQGVRMTALRTGNPNQTIDSAFTAVTYVYKEK